MRLTCRQGLDPSCFPHVFLVTSPRVLWYKFGPASFWYLYSEHQVLKALIVEVNNTFGERRIYFVKADTKTERPLDSVSLQKAVPFRSTWSKDFHVSPFSSRKGSYSLSAWDPYDTKDDDSRHRRNVDIVATLLSSKDEPKLVARLWSDGSPLDVTNVPVISAVGFLSLWGWVGLMTCKLRPSGINGRRDYSRLTVLLCRRANRTRSTHTWSLPPSAYMVSARTTTDCRLSDRKLERKVGNTDGFHPFSC